MNKEKLKEWHDRNYKKLLIIPAILLALSLVYLIVFSSTEGSIIRKDISLTGGTSATIYDSSLNTETLKSELSSKLEDVSVREIYDFVTREQKAVVLQTKSDGEVTKEVLEDYLGYELNEGNSSFEFTGSTLSQSFFKQLIIAIILAFVFMAVVVFIIFRTFVPSSAIIISAFADIVMTLALVNILGMSFSSAGIVALLMLIGYSVDTDILLTNRILKRSEGSLNERIYGAFKTGITMTLTSIVAVGVALLVVNSFSITLTQIFSIIVIGLGFDIINTWITNVSILKWYSRRKNG